MAQNKADSVGMRQITQVLQVIEGFCPYPISNGKPLVLIWGYHSQICV